jgi:ABC-type polysaccharide/polyol phosphate transport system ATPase subunit
LSQRGRREVVVALDGLDLEVARGEALGVIGPNGAGKTTLLKLIAGISRPTRGEVTAAGRVLGLIELGAGFHPDLTGVENIRLQGSIYGLSAAEVEARTPSILEFAELASFRHMPVRQYSSGMFVRLGFAIAMHVDPDVMLVDEVLAVGDQRFQERCLEAIQRLLARGAALVMVTHYPEQAERVCGRVAWIEQGRLRRLGPAAEVLADYHADLLARRYGTSQGPMSDETFAVGLPGRFGTGEARFEAVRLLDGLGRPRTHFRRGETIRIEIEYRAQPGVEAVDCTIPLDSPEGTILTYWRAELHGVLGRPLDGRGRFHLQIDHPPLLPGRYRMTLALSPPGRPNDHYDVLYKLFHFSIERDPGWETFAPIELRPSCEGGTPTVTNGFP